MTDTPTETVFDLILRLNRHLDYNSAWYRKLDASYHARPPLALLPEAVRSDDGDRLPTLRVNFVRAAVDAHEERLDVVGFRLPRSASFLGKRRWTASASPNT